MKQEQKSNSLTGIVNRTFEKTRQAFGSVMDDINHRLEQSIPFIWYTEALKEFVPRPKYSTITASSVATVEAITAAAALAYIALRPSIVQAQEIKAEDQCFLHFDMSENVNYPIVLNTLLSSQNVDPKTGIPATKEQINKGTFQFSLDSACKISYVRFGREYPGGTRNPDTEGFLGDQKPYDPTLEYVLLGIGYTLGNPKNGLFVRPAIEGESQFIRRKASPGSEGPDKVTNELYRLILVLGTPNVESTIAHTIDPAKSDNINRPETYDRYQGEFTTIQVKYSLNEGTLWTGANANVILGTFRARDWAPLPGVEPVDGTLGDFAGVGYGHAIGRTTLNATLLQYWPDIQIKHPVTGGVLYDPKPGTNVVLTWSVPLFNTPTK